MCPNFRDYLSRARGLFEQIYDEEFAGESEIKRDLAQRIELDPHFNALLDLLGHRVLARSFPGGWKRTPNSEE
jgi:hypothetical protein